MIERLRLKWQKPKPVQRDETPQEGFIPALDAITLLASSHRQALVRRIRQLTALSEQQFTTLYLQPIHRYAEWVQQLPASEHHHHSYLGGLLDHGLELMAFSLKLRQSHLLPLGSAPEDQTVQADAWSAGIAYGALLHDIGKIAVDLHIELSDGSTWRPWHGPIRSDYRFHYLKGRDYQLHEAASGLFHQQILTPKIQDWLSGYRELWSSLLYMLAGQHAHSGILGELVLQADRLSTAQNLGGNPDKLRNASSSSLQQHLLAGLRYLLEHDLKLNQPGAAGWLTQDSLWLVSKAVTDKLRAYLLSQGIEGVPTSNSRLFDEMQSHRLIIPTSDDKAIWTATVNEDGWQQQFTFIRLQPSLIWSNDERPVAFIGEVTLEEVASDKGNASAQQPTENQSPPQSDPHQASLDLKADLSLQAPESPSVHTAEHFMHWLRQGLANHKLLINDSRAMVHTVDGKVLLVTPAIFQRYAQEHPRQQPSSDDSSPQWMLLQRSFEKLGIHQKRPDHLNIWICTVEGPRKKSKIQGYLLEDSGLLFSSTPQDNPFIKIAS